MYYECRSLIIISVELIYRWVPVWCVVVSWTGGSGPMGWSLTPDYSMVRARYPTVQLTLAQTPRNTVCWRTVIARGKLPIDEQFPHKIILCKFTKNSPEYHVLVRATGYGIFPLRKSDQCAYGISLMFGLFSISLSLRSFSSFLLLLS